MPEPVSAVLDDLLDAFAQVSAVVHAEGMRAADGPDFTATLPDGRVVLGEIKTLAKPSATDVLGRIRAWQAEAAAQDRVLVVVADEVPRAARDALAGAGLSYFDRRGHLLLQAPGMVVERDVEPSTRDRAQPTGVRGEGGLATALACLVRPGDPPGIRETARLAGLSHTAIHRGRRALREANLIDRDGRPVVPELFEAVVTEWTLRQIVVGALSQGEEYRVEHSCGAHLDGPLFATIDELQAATPETTDRRTGIDPLGGWALGGTLAAAEYGAPVVVGRGVHPEVLVPAGTVSRVTAALAPLHHAGDSGMLVAPAPTMLATRLRRRGRHRIPLAHPVVVAIDLARDPSRGREILGDFHPEGVTRVWA